MRQAAVLREQQGARLLLRLESGRLVLESSQTGAGQTRVARKVPVLFRAGDYTHVLMPLKLE